MRTRLLTAITVCLAGLATASAAAAQVKTTALLPLARGHFQVSLGDSPQWLPVSGQELTLTLFSGRPRVGSADAAFIGLQSARHGCAATPAKVRPLYEIPHYYESAHLLARQSSPFAPDGGTAAGDYQASVNGITVHQSGSVRVCVWLSTSSRSHARDLAATLTLPLLNSTFAASVSNLPQASGSNSLSDSGGYTLDAFSGADSFSYSAATTNCGTTANDPSQSADGGDLATETISLSPSPCAGDGTRFTFRRAGGGMLGTFDYTVAEATAAPLVVGHLGACELDPVSGVPVSVAAQYVVADGCRVAEEQVSPYRSGTPHGTVLEAAVDGGVADLAPRGTAVDLIINGRP
jgi:hypothetical protein